MQQKNSWQQIGALVVTALTLGGGLYVYQFTTAFQKETKMLKEIVNRLTAETRIAEVLVTEVKFDPLVAKHQTTLKFLEYDIRGRPMMPRYFSFYGNVIQFQSLVVRFKDDLIKSGDDLKGKSVYLFWKAFYLDGASTQEYEITKVNAIPQGYKLEHQENTLEGVFWEKFWRYALDPKVAHGFGIKNAQIEAPGTKFVPGMVYTLNIEHDGGIRIDASAIPAILKGEKIGN